MPPLHITIVSFYLFLWGIGYHEVDSFAPLVLSSASAAQRSSATSRLLPMQMAQISSRTEDEIREDISRLEKEASERLQNLMDQMDDLMAFDSPPESSSTSNLSPEDSTIPSKSATMDSPKSLVDPVTTVAASTTPPTQKEQPTKATKTPPQRLVQPQIPARAPLDLLQDSTWRLVFNVGREEGTWMPKDWARSGDRLRFECKVNFGSHNASRTSDDFFHGRPVYPLQVSETYLWPTGVGVGRRELCLSGDAFYQVTPTPEQGDVLRLRIPLGEPLNRSDVTCPAGHLYVTANYFGLTEWHRPMREYAWQELQEAQQAVEKARKQLEDGDGEENGKHGALSWLGLWKPMGELWKAEFELEKKQESYQATVQRYPEKTHMRFDSGRRVALSKEGGLCLKIHSGVAIEYHILGRVEIGCVDREVPLEGLQ